MSETTELPTIKRFALTNQLNTSKSFFQSPKNELPKSVTAKLSFLKTHKQDLKKNALDDFISKKCITLSNNTQKDVNQSKESELNKVVSSRTAGLVNGTLMINNKTSARSSNLSRNSAETSIFFNRTKNPSTASKTNVQVSTMDEMDFDAVFGDDDDDICFVSTSQQKSKKVEAKNDTEFKKKTENYVKVESKLTLAKPSTSQTNVNNTPQTIQESPVASSSNERPNKAKKKFVFGRIKKTNVITNPFTGFSNYPQDTTRTLSNKFKKELISQKPTINSAKNVELSMPRTSHPNEKDVKIDSSNSDKVSKSPKTLTKTNDEKGMKFANEYANFLLSNIDWDNEDDLDLDKTEINPQTTQANATKSIITPDDYVDDDFDFSQLGVENNQQIDASNKAARTSVIDVDESLHLAFEDDFVNESDANPINFNSTINNMNYMQGPSCSNTEIEPRFVPIDKDAKTRKDDTVAFQKEYPHSACLREILHEKFGLKEFRPNQQEIINATLQLFDCFVLMPTGGGKSLCYQLPAILTPGVTIVISPLRALIVDQVNKLTSLDVPAAHMCAGQSTDARNTVTRALTQLEPSIKLLYLTPEKIIGSKATFDLLLGLYARGKLARIVLDEAHCLSQWGHDFRPDYKQLTTLKANFPKTPIMCLTATATNVVQQDVINILKLKNVKTFIRSFNRSNIKYEVLEKTKAIATAEITQLILQRFRRMSGIVYCLTRKDCDTLALDLRKNAIKAKAYHAGLTDKDREQVQAQWMNNDYNVICATIAFGMGIDKPDVRFVIHNSIPKSLEAFYQESGRAGRDGEVAYSYLFYAFSDVVRLQKIIRMDKSITKKNLEGHFDQIAQMAQYCENRIDCRRYLQLLHLGEKFNRQLCIKEKKTICDNCSNFGNIIVQNVAKESRELATLVRDLGNNRNYTMLHYVDVYRGSKLKKIIDLRHNNHKFYGAGAHFNKNDVHRIMKELSFKKVLQDVCEYSGDFPVIYVRPGPNYDYLFKPDIVLTIPITSKGKKAQATSWASDDGPSFVNEPPSPEIEMKPVASTSNNAPKKAALVSPSKTPERRIWAIKVKCYEELLEKCAEFAAQQQSNLSSIMNLSALKVMSEEMPGTAEDFMKIQYVTKANFEKYGKDFLLITQKYRRQVAVIDAENAINDLKEGFMDDDWGESPNENMNTSQRSKSGAVKKKLNTYRRGTWKKRRR